MLTNVLEKRLFYIPSFKIYNGVAGFYDYGPPGGYPPMRPSCASFMCVSHASFMRAPSMRAPMHPNMHHMHQLILGCRAIELTQGGDWGRSFLLRITPHAPQSVPLPSRPPPPRFQCHHAPHRLRH